MRRRQEQGSASLFMAIVLMTGVVLVALNVQSIRSNMKAREIKQKLAVAAGKNINQAAITYLYSALERHGVNDDPEVKINPSTKVFQGTSTAMLTLLGSKAIYTQIDLQKLNQARLAEAFSGSAASLWANPSVPKTTTEIKVLEVDDQSSWSAKVYYVVEAKTDVKVGSTIKPVKSVAKFMVHYELPPPSCSACSGQLEIPTDCASCVVAAQAVIDANMVTPYTADVNLTRNFGQYKTSNNLLCDIHFLQTHGQHIADHEGQTSSWLVDQVAIYCLCSCGWGGG